MEQGITIPPSGEDLASAQAGSSILIRRIRRSSACQSCSSTAGYQAQCYPIEIFLFLVPLTGSPLKCKPTPNTIAISCTGDGGLCNCLSAENHAQLPSYSGKADRY
ncbi:hypothetical protein ASPBRDRAFT_277996 [Aspergillus brasiliensis CBS 101740]|uniref:Uncharacterized protein n=1 Tax=Aspergillus brasiliensis (strain CBS 101740 / IMI 381727 / IBT 21946) TaxID=767769 RepID=A0A1L9UCP0_ASPBC|nr:hypothetical protein ASPBRDRAFT_277996 [Aspergillus brasiliensis CBS 101740]